MRLRFSKMHGLGNDFMVIDLVTQAAHLTPEQISTWADRRLGIGFDQLLVVEPPTDPSADFRYRIYNSDGTEAEQCGNGARCFARFVFERRLTPKKQLLLDTNNRRIATSILNDGDVEVDMGAPSFEPIDVPYRGPAASDGVQSVDIDGETIAFTAVSVGNPHAVIDVPDVANAPVQRLGAALTRHPDFPEGVNVGFCQRVDENFVRLRVFERGVGETQACGTGACAAVAAGIYTGRLGNNVKVSLPGGKLRLSWSGGDASIKMIGPAALSFEGSIEI
ncbi:MAG: diaminopimelate epimerase [Pseudomonadaceae bacterium]|nr:diaminopimelate epimerase [Pseudomonadaceae bacterium]